MSISVKIPNLETQERIATAVEKMAGDYLKAVIKQQWLDMHPVGYIWTSFSSTDPSEIVGGTWQQLKDVSLVAAGDTFQTSTITKNQDGGEATHTLTIDEIPSHSHTAGSYDGLKIKNDWFETSGGSIPHNVIGVINGENHNFEYGLSTRILTNTTGGGQSHNNMGPYKVVYMWVRIA